MKAVEVAHWISKHEIDLVRTKMWSACELLAALHFLQFSVPKREFKVKNGFQKEGIRQLVALQNYRLNNKLTLKIMILSEAAI